MRYKIEFKYRYGEDYVYCNEYRQDDCSLLRKTVNLYVLLQKQI